MLALVLADPARRWTIDELADRTGEPYQTVATEVRRLQTADLLEATAIGRTKLLSANEANPYMQPLSQLATMAFGPPIVIGEEFVPLNGVEAVYVYGSWATRYRGEPGPAPNDIDVASSATPTSARDTSCQMVSLDAAELGRYRTSQHRMDGPTRAGARRIDTSLIHRPRPDDRLTLDSETKLRSISS